MRRMLWRKLMARLLVVVVFVSWWVDVLWSVKPFNITFWDQDITEGKGQMDADM